MKTNKKILLIATSVAITVVISILLALGLYIIFGWNIIGCSLFFTVLQLSWSIYRSEYLDRKKIVEAVQEYSKKPYKKYLIPINCGHCGSKNELEIDLTDTEFQCDNCKKYNGLHVNFMAAAITEPIINPEL
jgi:hypothetical protein